MAPLREALCSSFVYIIPKVSFCHHRPFLLSQALHTLYAQRSTDRSVLYHEGRLLCKTFCLFSNPYFLFRFVSSRLISFRETIVTLFSVLFMLVCDVPYSVPNSLEQIFPKRPTAGSIRHESQLPALSSLLRNQIAPHLEARSPLDS